MEIVNTLTPIAIGFFLALVGIVLLWRDVIQPDALAKMEVIAASTEARMDRMRASQDRLQNELEELRGEMLSDREELADMKIEMAEWRHGMTLVFEQMRVANLTPAWQPRQRPARQTSKPSSRANNTLAARIARQFNMDELNGLAYDMGVVSEEFSGQTTTARARELVDMAYRRGFSAALIKRINELRPEENI